MSQIPKGATHRTNAYNYYRLVGNKVERYREHEGWRFSLFSSDHLRYSAHFTPIDNQLVIEAWLKEN